MTKPRLSLNTIRPFVLPALGIPFFGLLWGFITFLFFFAYAFILSVLAGTAIGWWTGAGQSRHVVNPIFLSMWFTLYVVMVVSAFMIRPNGSRNRIVRLFTPFYIFEGFGPLSDALVEREDDFDMEPYIDAVRTCGLLFLFLFHFASTSGGLWLADRSRFEVGGLMSEDWYQKPPAYLINPWLVYAADQVCRVILFDIFDIYGISLSPIRHMNTFWISTHVFVFRMVISFTFIKMLLVSYHLVHSRIQINGVSEAKTRALHEPRRRRR